MAATVAIANPAIASPLDLLNMPIIDRMKAGIKRINAKICKKGIHKVVIDINEKMNPNNPGTFLDFLSGSYTLCGYCCGYCC